MGNSYICTEYALLRVKTSVRTLQFDDNVMQHFEKNPSTKNCAVGHAVSMNHRLVYNVVHE